MTLDKRHMDWIEGRGIDLELAARFGLDTTNDASGLWLTVPYREAGATVNHKHRRCRDKGFRMDTGAPLTLWNRDVLDDDTLDAEPLIVTEGEMDALAAMTAGKLRVVSVPNGAPGIADDTSESLASPDGGKRYQYLWRARAQLDTVKQVVLAVDNDPPGLKLAADLARWFGPERCRWVQYPEGCKDLNDVLLAHDPATVARILDAAKPYPVKGLYTFDDFPELPPMHGISTGIAALDEYFQFVPGTLSVWTGFANMGKTSLMLSALGGAMRRGYNVTLGSFETLPKPILQRRMRAAIARCGEYETDPEVIAAADEILADRFRIIAQSLDNADDEMTLEYLIELFKVAVIRDDARIIVIDPWNEIEHKRGKDESETDYTGRAIRQLKAFAKNYDVAVVIVAHPAKPDTTRKLTPPGLYSISGSAHWANKPDYGLCVHQSDPDPETTRRDVIVSKVRMGLPGKRGMLSLSYDRNTSTYAKSSVIAFADE